MYSVAQENVYKKTNYSFDLAGKLFFTAVERLSAEYVLLNKSREIDVQAFGLALKQTHSHGYTFNCDEINSEFVSAGKFISHDENYAAEVLADSLLDYWFGKSGFSISEQKQAAIEKYKEKITLLFAEVPKVVPDKLILASLTDCTENNAYVKVSEHEILEQVIKGELEAGDSINRATLSNGINIKFAKFYPIFRTLLSQRENDVVLKTSDTDSIGFILAFIESLAFSLPNHKKEFLARIATLLKHEGKRI